MILPQVRKSGGSKLPLSQEWFNVNSLPLLQDQFVGSGRSLELDYPTFDSSFSTSQTFGRNIKRVHLKNDQTIVPVPVYIPKNILEIEATKSKVVEAKNTEEMLDEREENFNNETVSVIKETNNNVRELKL